MRCDDFKSVHGVYDKAGGGHVNVKLHFLWF